MFNYTHAKTLLPTERRWAIITGGSLLFMAVAGGFAFGYVHPILHIAGDSEATSDALNARPLLLYAIVVAWNLVALLDVVASVGIYRVYRRWAPKLSVLVAAIRLIYTMVLVVAVAQLGSLSLIDDMGNGLKRFEVFEAIWSVGLVVFGLHLLVLSYLILVIRYPGILVSIALSLGGIGYIVLNGLKFVDTEAMAIAPVIEALINVPMVLGELSFAVCLLFVGHHARNWRRDNSRRLLLCRLLSRS